MTARKTGTAPSAVSQKPSPRPSRKKTAKPAQPVRKTARAASPASAVRQELAFYDVGDVGHAGRARSHAMAAIHSAAADLHAAGALDLVTMRHFDRACLSEQAIGPDEVRAIRQANRVSQTVFARCLGTSESTVKQWESGAKRPSGMARTLLNAVRKHGIEVLS